MARIEASVVAEVVAEVSERMKDPTYAQVAIGGFAQAQPDIGRFLTAHLDDLGGGEAVMHAVFHAEVLTECIHRGLDAAIDRVSFRDLDRVADDPEPKLAEREPALSAFLEQNLESPPMRRLLALVALALLEAANGR